MKLSKNGYHISLLSAKKKLSQETLSVRDRELKGQQQNMTLDQLIVKVSEKIAGKPFKPLPLADVPVQATAVPRLINETYVSLT